MILLLYPYCINIISISILLRCILYRSCCYFSNNKFLRLEKLIEKNLPSFSHRRCFNHSQPSLRFSVVIRIDTYDFRNYGSFSTLIATASRWWDSHQENLAYLFRQFQKVFETLIIFFCNFTVCKNRYGGLYW